MALIKCKYCEKDISDKATKCPHCGQELIEPVKRVCEECGFEIVDGDVVCNNCGCPVKVEDTENITKQNGNIKILPFKLDIKKIGIGVGVLIIVVLSIFFILQHKQQISHNDYKEKFNAAATVMMFDGEGALTTTDLIRAVWYNAIYEERDPLTDEYCCPKYYFVDFDEAISNLSEDSKYQTKMEAIQKGRDKLAKTMAELKNPPKEYKEAYEVLKELYTEYIVVTNLAINPTGSLTTYGESCNDEEQKFEMLCEKIEMYTDEAEEDY